MPTVSQAINRPPNKDVRCTQSVVNSKTSSGPRRDSFQTLRDLKPRRFGEAETRKPGMPWRSLKHCAGSSSSSKFRPPPTFGSYSVRYPHEMWVRDGISARAAVTADDVSAKPKLASDERSDGAVGVEGLEPPTLSV